MVENTAVVGNLHVRLILGAPRDDKSGGIDQEDLLLTLTYNDKSVASAGLSGGFFDREMEEIQFALPKGTYMQACLTCACSAIHPVGKGCFSGLACFRDNKEAIKSVKDRYELMAIWKTRTEFVQETYLCPEYEKAKHI